MPAPQSSSSRGSSQQTDYQKVQLSTGETLQIGGCSYSAAVVEGLQPKMLAALSSGTLPAIHFKNAVSLEWCDLVSAGFTRHPATKKEDVLPPIYSLGNHLYSCPAGESYSYYFSKIDQSNSAIAEILPNGWDPIVSFLKEACEIVGSEFEYLTVDRFSIRHGSLRMWGKDSGSTSDGRCYFAVPHEDYEETNNNHRLPQIYQSNNVYSIVLCLDAVHDHEPETIVWNQRMSLKEISDPQNKHSWASYGYRESLFQDVDSMLIRLKKGDAAIIPAHNVHAVIGYPGFQRCTYMAFFHLIDAQPTGFSKMIFRT